VRLGEARDTHCGALRGAALYAPEDYPRCMLPRVSHFSDFGRDFISPLDNGNSKDYRKREQMLEEPIVHS
jgi:hypothetical protein